MNKDPYANLQSSLPLEDFLAQPNRISQNWLLTYLDVFVLIIMLVVTIITVSDLNIQQAEVKKSRIVKKIAPVICPPAPKPAEVVCPAVPSTPVVIAEPKTEPPTAIVNQQPVEVKSDVRSDQVEIASEKTKLIEAEPTEVVLSEENKLQQQLEKSIDDFGLSKIVTIKVSHGYAQLEIQDKLLFKSSEADLTAAGGDLIRRLIPILKQSVGLIIIEGHTDNIPIKTAKFRSNWELGSSRATSVLHFLVLQQIESSRLRATTYADTMPIADNSTPEGREKNRRVNILVRFSG